MDSRKGIEHESLLRGAHSDNANIGGAGSIHAVIRQYCTPEQIDGADYTLTAKFSSLAYVAKVLSESMRHVNILKDYYPLLFKKLKAFADANELTVIQLLEYIVEGRYDLQQDIFPVEI